MDVDDILSVFFECEVFVYAVQNYNTEVYKHVSKKFPYDSKTC